ncbi:MAG: alpha-amylase [Bacteroidales bacterium]|nr:alpha-amylase [Bacteroidales bacterium]
MNGKIKTPAWVAGKTIYEVNLRQFTKEGTIKAFEAHLQRLKDLGVGILWFMPIQPIGKKNRKGTLGSYYSIRNYTEVNPEFGTLDDFKSLVQKIHDLGMKVIIDWVANHTAWDHHWTVDYPEYYDRDEKGNFKPPVKDWEDVIHLDYGNPDLWNAMIDAMKFWINEAGIDGFRCDMAHLVTTLFWNRARQVLDVMKPVYMLAESENYDLLEYAFDTIYNWKLMHAMNDIASGKISANNLAEVIVNEFQYLPEGASSLNFTSNHDENSWQGSAIERLHYYLEPLTVLTFMIPGRPLIYSGQEAGNYRRLKFFDKDEIEWKEDKMFGLYQKLTKFKATKLLHLSNINFIKNDCQDAIISLSISNEKHKVLVILNLSGKKQGFYIKCSDINRDYNNVVDGQKLSFSCHDQLSLESYGYLILWKDH